MKTLVSRILATVAALSMSWTCAVAQDTAIPDAINFQAVARNAAGDPMGSANVGVRIRISTESPNGTVVYEETHVALTDDLGHFGLLIGRGTVTPGSGAFASIPWGKSPAMWLSIGLDLANSGSYVGMGSQELLSVPYAIYARYAQRSDTARYAEEFSGILPIERGGTGGNDIPVGGGVAYGDGSRIRYVQPGQPGQILTSNGNEQPAWKAAIDLVDSAFANKVGMTLIRDRQFTDSLVKLIGPALAHDTSFIHELGSDTEFQRVIREIVKDLVSDTGNTLVYEIFRDSLVGDSTFLEAIYVNFRNRITKDSTWVDQVFNNEYFITRLRQIIGNGGGGNNWALTGNAGTTAASYLGTSDARPLILSTNKDERFRISPTGNIGIGTNVPNHLLEVNGALGIAGALYVNDNPGLPGQILTSNGSGVVQWRNDVSVNTVNTNNFYVSSTSRFDSTVVFNDTVIFNGPVDLALNNGNMFVGNVNNRAAQLAPGSNGQVLSVVAGRPNWTTPVTAENPFIKDTLVINNRVTEMRSDTVLFSDTSVVIFNSTPEIPLMRGHLFVGNSADIGTGLPPGQANTILSMGADGFPRWTTAASLSNVSGGRMTLAPGLTSIVINDTRITATSAVTITYEDLNDTGFVFAQIISRSTGSVRIRFSAPIPSGAQGVINYTIAN